MPDAAGGDESYRLSTWMLERSEPLHPVAVRYFLYQVSLKLTQHLEELASRNRNLKEHIIRYDRAYDLPETEEVETVQDRLRAALDQSLFRRAFHNQFKELTGEYQEKAERQLRRLREYKVSKLTEEVYDDILKAIATMLKKWEDYFHGLREIQIQLSGEIDLRAREHEGRSNPTAVHVLSSREDKERLWEEQRSSLTIGRDLPPEIRERIYRGRYREFCRDHYEKGPATAGSDNTAKLFREEIFGWCRKTIQELGFLDFNVVKAIRTEALLRGIDPESHLKERVGNLDRRAWPFVPDVSELARSQSYWGIHTDCAHEVSEQDRREIFGQPVEIIVDEAFCRYEVVRYRAHYNLSATDFPKFSAGDSQSAESRPGAYFLSYKKRILDLTMAGNTVSPHLDKRWHLPAYMPDLNRSIADLDQLKIDRAFVLGLVHGRLRSGSVDQRDVWEYYGESGRKFVVVGDRRIPGRYHDLYEAMHHNPAIVDGILDYAEAEWERGLGIKDVLDHAFCKGSRNVNGTGDPILESIFRFLEEVPHEDLQEKTEHLLNRCLGEMEHYFLNAYGSHRRNEAGATLSRFIGELCEGSKTYQAARLDGSEAYRGWRECIDQFTKTLLTTSGVEPSQPLHSPE